MITPVDLYPGSTFGYCPECKCTCEPELFVESDGASRLVCVRCLGPSYNPTAEVVDDDDVAEDDYDRESAGAYDQWWRSKGGLSDKMGLELCNAHDCRIHTAGRCVLCKQGTCKEHTSANGRCQDCEHVARLLN